MAVDHSRQLTLISETIRLGDVTFGAHGLEFGPDFNEADLLTVGHRLFATRSYIKWALGSLFAEMIKRRTRKKEGIENEDAGQEWARDLAQARELDPKEYREVLGVFLFYRGVETPGLSFEHHREAMWGVDDGKPEQLSRAVAFLLHAQQHDLTFTQLRRHIRSSYPGEAPEPRQMELAQYNAVFDFMRFAKRELDDVHTYTPERARMVLADLGEAALSYIDALRKIAKVPDSHDI